MQQQNSGNETQAEGPLAILCQQVNYVLSFLIEGKPL